MSFGFTGNRSGAAQPLAANLTTLAGLASIANLTALAGLATTAGLIEQTGDHLFGIRAIGVGAAGSIPARSDADARYAASSLIGAVGGIATLDGAGLVPGSQMPLIAITKRTVVNSEINQLAIVAQEGDVAIRTDLNRSYIHNGGVAGTMADWSELLTPTDTVLSVNGETGAVSLVAGDIPFTPAGDVAATDLQAAIAEVDAEKQPLTAILTSLSSLPSTLGLLEQTADNVLGVRQFGTSGATVPLWNGAAGTWANAPTFSSGILTVNGGTVSIAGITLTNSGETLYIDVAAGEAVITRVDLGAVSNLSGTGVSITGDVDVSGVFKVDGTQVVSNRGAALPADASDLATAIALANATKSRVATHGLAA